METLWDIGELGRLANIKVATLRKYVAQRKVPFVKVGRLVRFRPSEVEQWISQCAHAVQERPEITAGQDSPEFVWEGEEAGEQDLFSGLDGEGI
jgi:excisionase family DNA binding protein